MAENENKRRRITRIGNLPSGKGSSKLQCDDERMQADCNLVYNIMQSMNKSQNPMSYQQLENLQYRERANSQTNNTIQNSSSKQNGKTCSSKQIKRLIPEKTFPLMAKCQKSMKYLKKNRCIPKPRAHVGFIPKPSQITSSLKPNIVINKCSVPNTANQKECFVKLNQNSKKSRDSPEMNDRRKKAKIAHSVDNSRDANVMHSESLDKEPKFISDTDIDSDDDEFEHFLQKHHPEKFTRRKGKKINKSKRKNEIMCAKKINRVTRKTLSEFEDSAESEIESNALVENGKSMNVVKKFPQRSFQRIIDYENSEDSETDIHVKDFGTENNDSFSSSEDENLAVSKSLTEEKMFDSDNSTKFGEPPAEPSSVASLSASLFELKDSFEELKLKCKIPCYVVINRDSLLDEKAASLCVKNSSVTNGVNITTSHDDDDCIIIIENDSQSIGNSNQAESVITKSSFFPDALIDGNAARYELMPDEGLTTSSNEETAEIIQVDERRSWEVQNDVSKDERKASSCVTAGSKSLCETENDESLISKSTSPSVKNINSSEFEKRKASKVNPTSRRESDLRSIETDIPLSNVTSISDLGNEMFNVQILSVQSLIESDIIVLSDDDEEKDLGTVPAVNGTKDCASEDTDIEIICLDTCKVNDEKCVNANVKKVNHDTHDGVNGGTQENISKSSVKAIVTIEDDCIILDDLDIPNENFSTAKNVGNVQQSQVVDVINNEKTKSNVNTPVNALHSVKDSILKTLETIDINCINKVLNETSAVVTEKNSLHRKSENSKGDNIHSSEKKSDPVEKRKQNENGTPVSQKEVSIDKNLSRIDLLGDKTLPIDSCEKHPKSVPNSSICHSIESGPKKRQNSIKMENMPSRSDKNSLVSYNSSSVTKLRVSEKEIASSHRIRPSALLNSGNNQTLPVRAKMERCESPSDELDIIAAKSIKNLDEKEKKTIVPLLELYRAEYAKFIDIKCTEENVTAGLKLLEEKQAKKLLAISSSIKNIVKKDVCLQKVIEIKSEPVLENKSLEKVKKPLDNVTAAPIGKHPGIVKDDQIKILNPLVVERASEVLKSVGSSSKQEVYNHLINSVCAECGRHAKSACLGCAKVYFCSESCGMSYWNKGHNVTCRR